MMLWDHGHPYIQSTPVLCDTQSVHVYRYDNPPPIPVPVPPRPPVPNPPVPKPPVLLNNPPPPSYEIYIHINSIVYSI